jgi:iron complex transport system permease protein
MGRNKILRAYIIGIFAWILAFLAALHWGSVANADLGVVTQLRLPRVLLASAVGMALGVSGAALQALFSNPLCEPYTLGISSGSALGAVLGVVLGLEWVVAGLAGTAFAGALVFTAILLFFSRRTSTSGGGNLTLLIAGVMLGFLGSSLVALAMATSDSRGVQGAIVWLLGDLSRARLSGAVFSGVSVLTLSWTIWNHRKELDALLMGEEQAATLGVNVSRARRRIVLFTSLMIAVAVSAGGMIGFVGLIVPHFVRKMVGSLHFHLIPLCAIWGALVLILADGFARVVAAPYELPVGAVTAVIGAPLALWVILYRRSAA